jgi:DNA-binding transcriptional MerR regulator
MANSEGCYGDKLHMHPIFSAKTHSDEPIFYIGKAAEITGASRKAIRHYEAIGLLPAPQRRGNYRVYSERQVFMIHMIKHAQIFGFTLAETRALVAEVAKQKYFPLKFATDFIERKRQQLQQEVVKLQQMDKNLVDLKAQMNSMFG